MFGGKNHGDYIFLWVSMDLNSGLQMKRFF